MLIQKLKMKFDAKTWLSKFYPEMQVVISIESKTYTKQLSNLFYRAYNQSPQGLHNFVRMLLRMQLPEKAIFFLEPLVKEQSSNVELRRLLAAAFRYTGNFEDSLAHLKECLELAPEDGWVYGGLGLTFREMNKLGEAESFLRRAVELDKQSPWLPCQLGFTLQKKGNHAEALQLFQQTISLDLEYASPHNGLADIYLEYLKQPEKAIAEYETALQLEQRPFRLDRPIFGLARALETAGRTAEARQRYQEYLDRFPWGEHAPEALAALERLGVREMGGEGEWEKRRRGEKIN
jgi:tetratricopeptide (TPR) repeat protein